MYMTILPKKKSPDYQSDKYFVPASNTKLFSLYAGMKYLGDSIEGISYTEDDTALFVFAMGDPSFLHPDFQSQPVFDFLKKTNKKIYLVCHQTNGRKRPGDRDGPGMIIMMTMPLSAARFRCMEILSDGPSRNRRRSNAIAFGANGYLFPVHRKFPGRSGLALTVCPKHSW